MTPPGRTLAEYWPICGLRLATPRLTLAPLRDDDLVETLDVVLAGLHDPARMPFSAPWTDAPPGELVASALRHYWTTRGGNNPESWALPFVVRRHGELVGMQEIGSKNFAVTRTIHSGSWVGRAYQGAGVGTEMRSAVLQFAFDHLKAERADSGAFLDNPSSLRVSEKLGYRPDGTAVVQRRPGERAVEQHLTLDPADLVRPEWVVQVWGLAACLSFFGL